MRIAIAVVVLLCTLSVAAADLAELATVGVLEQQAWGPIRAVAEHDGYLYLSRSGDGDRGLLIIDMREPANPVVAGSYAPTAEYGELAFQGSTAYAIIYLDGTHGGFDILDISTPAAPVKVGDYRPPESNYGRFSDIELVGDYVFLAGEMSGFQVVSIAEPTGPILATSGGGAGGSLAIPRRSSPGDCPETQFAYMASFHGVSRTYSCRPEALGNPSPSWDLTGDFAWSAVSSESVLAFMAGYNSSTATLHQIHFYDPWTHDPLSIWTSPEPIADLNLGAGGQHAYVSGLSGKLMVVDVLSPTAPVEVAFADLGIAFPLILPTSWNTYAVDRAGSGLVAIESLTVFADLAWDNWAASEVAACAASNIVSGFPDGTYQPALAVDRAAMAAYISRTLAGGEGAVPPGPAEPTFSDVLPIHWAYRYIEYAHAAGVVYGYDGDYRPNEQVDRGQMAVFVARALVGGEGFVPAGPAVPTFPDVPEGFWCYPHVEYIAGRQVTAGYPDGWYHHEYPCTRDQIAVYMERAFLR